MLRVRLRDARIARNMTPAQVASAIGISERAYRYIEAGEKKPSLDTAVKLEALLGIAPRELLVQDDSNAEGAKGQQDDCTA